MNNNNNNNNNNEDFSSINCFATCWFSTLMTISGHLKILLVTKLLNIKSYMYILTYLYNLIYVHREISERDFSFN